MTGLKKAAAAYLAMVGLMLASGVAIAQEPVVVQAEVPRAAVSYADLNLSSAAGRITLRARVKSAASRLCLHSGTQLLTERIARARCFNKAMAGAETQIADAVARNATRLAAQRTIEVAARK